MLFVKNLSNKYVNYSTLFASVILIIFTIQTKIVSYFLFVLRTVTLIDV